MSPLFESETTTREDLEKLLSPQTVERICEQCGIARTVKRKSAKKPLCPRCANINRRTSRNLLPSSKGFLEYLYWEQKLSMNRIGKMYNVSPGTVDAKLKEFGIKTRTQHEGQLLRGIANSGVNNPNYKNGRTQNGKDGYIFILKPEHPKAHQGYVREHLLVWEEAHGKSLPDGWVIHHLNGVKNDNRIENLVAMKDKSHIRLIPKLQHRIRELEKKLICP